MFPVGKDRILASYEAGASSVAYVEPIAVGDDSCRTWHCSLPAACMSRVPLEADLPLRPGKPAPRRYASPSRRACFRKRRRRKIRTNRLGRGSGTNGSTEMCRSSRACRQQCSIWDGLSSQRLNQQHRPDQEKSDMDKAEKRRPFRRWLSARPRKIAARTLGKDQR